MKNSKESLKTDFEWESELFIDLIDVPDEDLIKILKQVYNYDSEKYNKILEKEEDLLKEKSKQIEKERSFIQSQSMS